ncbi:AAA family ATPase [Brachybacterium sp. HMSC06H03]|nr:AAA family ATPase [Brachybacterium sp. HMSC06H03]
MIPIPAVLVIGSAGSGKSTVAAAIARALHAALLDKDDIADRFTGALLTANGEDAGARDGSAFYVETVRPLEYSTLLALTSANLRNGLPVVLDAPFGAYFADPGYIMRARADGGWPEETRPIVVRVSASGETTRRRLIERGLDRDRWKLEHWDEFWSSIGDARPHWRGVPIIEVTNDEDGRSAERAREVLEQLQKL